MNQMPNCPTFAAAVTAPIKPEAFAHHISSACVGGAAVRSGPGSLKISVVIVAYCEQQSLLELLAVLVRTAARNDAEIILVDNGLDDAVVAVAQPLVHRYIKCAGNLGASQGRNIGAAFCAADLIAFIDADGAIDEQYLAACVAAMANPTLIAVRGRVLPKKPAGQLPTHYDLGPIPGPAPISTEGASVWRATVFRNVGGFEASLFGREGPELCYRLHVRFGYQTVAFGYAPSIVLYHNYFASESHLDAKLLRNARVIDQVDRAYPMMRLFLSSFAPLGQRKSANLRVRAKSLWVVSKVRLQQHLQHLTSSDGRQPAASVCVVVDGGASQRAVQCVARQTVPGAGIVVVAKSESMPSHPQSDWQLHVRGDDWLHPTLIERIGNVFRQQPELQIIVVPRARARWHIIGSDHTDITRPDTFAFAVRNVPESDVSQMIRDVAGARCPFVVMPASPILVAQYRPAESLVASAVLALRKKRRQGI
jgi:glycosyltransferase involved in cell wall biosynthesis